MDTSRTMQLHNQQKRTLNFNSSSTRWPWCNITIHTVKFLTRTQKIATNKSRSSKKPKTCLTQGLCTSIMLMLPWVRNLISWRNGDCSNRMKLSVMLTGATRAQFSRQSTARHALTTQFLIPWPVYASIAMSSFTIGLRLVVIRALLKRVRIITRLWRLRELKTTLLAQ